MVVDSWGEGAPDDTQAIAGYDSVSGVFRRVLVDETGKLQVDVIASVAISGETVKIASGGFVTAKIDTAASSGQFITTTMTSGGFVTAGLTSGGFVTAGLTSGGFVTAGLTSGGFITANVTSGSVVRILDPSGMSGLRVIQDTSGISGQFVVLNGYDSISGVYRRLITNSVGALIDKPYLYEIAQGHISGRSSWFKLGFNGGTGTTEEDLIVQGGTYVFPTSARQMMIKSSEIGDKAAGSGGVISVTLYYLDNNYIAGNESLNLNGTTGVNTVATNIYRIQNMRVTSVGSTGAPIGNLSLTDISGSVTYGYIGSGQHRQRQGVWTVPASTTLYITSVKVSANPGTANKYTRFTTRANFDDKAGVGTSGFYMPYHEIFTVDTPYTIDLEIPTKLPQRTDLKVSAVTEAGAGTATVALRGWTETE